MLTTLLCVNRKSRALESSACCSALTSDVGVQVTLLDVDDGTSESIGTIVVIVDLASSVVNEVMF